MIDNSTHPEENPMPAPVDVEPHDDQLSLVPELAGIEFTPVGATVVGLFDPDAVVERLGRLARTETWNRWAVGDLMLALADAYDVEHPDDPAGSGRAAAYRAADGLGYNASWLAGAVIVADRVPVEHRRPGLSWGHHKAVAADDIDPSEQSMWLGRAVANGWSVRQLETAIDEHRARDQGRLDVGDDDAPPPVPKLDKRVVARIWETAAVSPDGWVLVHPATGQVRAKAS